ncbi:MAG TPA: hypothetical protein VNB64_09140 [Solirubrobacteraceae bacterium]|nr:hypothetical protein [Solirubrobacteraceae bacterium]
MTETERPEREPNATTPDAETPPPADAGDESPEEFAAEIEDDPSHNPPDEDLNDIRGG